MSFELPSSEIPANDEAVIAISEATDSSAPLEAPERILPEVSFDIRIGKKYRYVDFDYDAYFQKATEMGMTPEQIAAVSVHFKKPSYSPLRGGYNRYDKKTEVRMARRANKTLVHELKHAADDTKGKLGNPVINVLGNIGNLSYLPLLGTDLAVDLVQLAGNTKVLESIEANAARGQNVAWFLIMTCYYLTPKEIRARRTARKNKTTILAGIPK